MLDSMKQTKREVYRFSTSQHDPEITIASENGEDSCPRVLARIGIRNLNKERRAEGGTGAIDKARGSEALKYCVIARRECVALIHARLT